MHLEMTSCILYCRVSTVKFVLLFSLYAGLTVLNKMMSDASDMLAAALEQMDGIIAGKAF